MFNNFYKNLLKFLKKNRKIVLIAVFALIVFLSIFPRSVEVLNQNPIFLFDQGREMQAVKNIVIDHKITLIGTELGAGSAGISGIFHGPFYYYLLTIPFILFDGSPAGAVNLMLFFGLLTVAFGYYFGKKIFGTFGGLTLALLLSVSPVFTAQSRFIWSPNLATLFILLSFYFTYLLSQNKKILYVFLASFFAGFVYNFEFAIAVPMCIALLIYSFFLFRKDFKKYAYLFLGFLSAFFPMLLFEARHNFMGAKGLINYLTVDKNIAEKPLSSYVFDHINSFLFNFRNSFNIDSGYLSGILWILLIGISVYLIKKEKNINLKYFFSFLVFLIPVNFFVFSFLRNSVWNYYLTDLSLVYILIFVYLAYAFIKNKYLSFFSFILIFSFTIVGLISAVETSLYDYFDYGVTAKIKGKIDAIDYIYKDARGKPFGILVFSPPVYTYPYDYLLWWHGEKKYHYIPYKEKKGTFYLLIEPDPYKPWSYNGWLETVIKTGNIEWNKTLPSGFIIQKRTVNG